MQTCALGCEQLDLCAELEGARGAGGGERGVADDEVDVAGAVGGCEEGGHCDC